MNTDTIKAIAGNDSYVGLVNLVERAGKPVASLDVPPSARPSSYPAPRPTVPQARFRFYPCGDRPY